MLGARRAQDEDWVPFVVRATHKAEDMASSLGSPDWVSLQRRKKWRLAGKLAASNDNRWGRRLLEWRPWFRTTPWRTVGRPVARWTDDLCRFARGSWVDTAQDGDMWAILEEGFVAQL